jgi:hypothetical protein
MKVYGLVSQTAVTPARCSEMNQECEHVSGNSIQNYKD